MYKKEGKGRNLAKIGGNTDKRSSVYEPPMTTGAHTSNKSLHITSTQPISVYAFNAGQNVTDATIVLPVHAWGTNYYRFDHATANYIFDTYNIDMIIAREATTLTTPEGVVNLNAGDVWYYASASEMTGRHITSNKPVAYFTHNTMASVPLSRRFYDILFQQMMSVDKWGKTFLVPNAQQGANDMNNLIRIVAAENGTVVNFSGASRNGGQNISSGGTLNAGQWVELLISSNTGACFIEASKAVGVCAYLVGDGHENNDVYYYLGDPSIAWIPALNQFIKSIIVAPFYPLGTIEQTKLNNANATHAIIIIAKKDTKTSTTINGLNITSGWTDNGNYSYYRKVFNNTTDRESAFLVENPNGVLVMAYGISNIESYYYNAGSGACVIN